MSRNNIVATFARNLNNAANAAKSPITNLASNISSAIISNSNSLNTLNTTAGMHFYMWLIVLVIGISIIYLIKRYVIDEHPGMIESWFAMFRNEQRRGIPDAPSPTIVPPQKPAAVHPDTESWCFVGEDLTGRYCVKVPSASSCESSRRFISRQDCEMIPAQHLPAGIIAKQGTQMLPLASS